MFPSPSSRKTFVVPCMQCHRDIPSGVREFPIQSITVECPLCGELRRYLLSEVFLALNTIKSATQFNVRTVKSSGGRRYPCCPLFTGVNQRPAQIES